jgi:hypothetical protein
MLAAAPSLFYGTDSLHSPALVCGVGDATLRGNPYQSEPEDAAGGVGGASGGMIISYRTQEGFPRLAVAW